MVDVLHFDQAFFGGLSFIGTLIAISCMAFCGKMLTERSPGFVLFWLIAILFLLRCLTIGLYYGVGEWMDLHFGFGTRAIAVVCSAMAPPFSQLSLIPILAIVAYHAPEGKKAAWFALVGSLLNLSVAVGAIFTKYLNAAFVVTREVRGPMGEVIVQMDYTRLS